LKIEGNSYDFNHIETSISDLKKQVEQVAAPFRIIMEEKQFKLEIVQHQSLP